MKRLVKKSGCIDQEQELIIWCLVEKEKHNFLCCSWPFNFSPSHSLSLSHTHTLYNTERKGKCEQRVVVGETWGELSDLVRRWSSSGQIISNVMIEKLAKTITLSQSPLYSTSTSNPPPLPSINSKINQLNLAGFSLNSSNYFDSFKRFWQNGKMLVREREREWKSERVTEGVGEVVVWLENCHAIDFPANSMEINGTPSKLHGSNRIMEKPSIFHFISLDPHWRSF